MHDQTPDNPRRSYTARRLRRADLAASAGIPRGHVVWTDGSVPLRTPADVALVHDYLLVMRGAERTFSAIASCWPEAPIYTLLYDERETRDAFSGREVIASRLQGLGVRQKGFRRLLPLLPWAVRSLDVGGFSVVVSSSSAFAHGVETHPDALHVCYCHTPFRYAWHAREQAIAEAPRALRAPASRVLDRIRRWDAAAAGRVTHYVANSELVRERIARSYGREATVVHPPVEVERFQTGEPEDFLLLVGEVVRHKRFEVALEAARRARRRVKVVGEGPELSALRERHRGTAEFLGRVSDGELERLYASCLGLIVPGVEEFGIAAVEAQASGRPVIAANAGGARETVIDGETGVLVRAGDVDALARAIEQTDFDRFDPADLRRQAERFSTDAFRRRFLAVVEAAIDAHNRPPPSARPGGAAPTKVHEAAFHDAIASTLDPADMPPRDPDDIDRGLLEWLGPIDGARVLELGCGTGDLTLQLLERGARVTAMDISAGAISVTRGRVEAWLPEARAELSVADAEATGLPAGSFDFVVGKWLLHHVDVERAGIEIERVLTAGGTALFGENSGRNPIISFARKRVAGRLGIPRYGTRDEHPLVDSDYALLRERFRDIELRYPDFFFFRLFDRQVVRARVPTLSRVTDGMDAWVWKRLPALRAHSFHVLVRLEKA